MTREQKIRWDNYAVHQYALEEGHMDGHAIMFSEMVTIAYELKSRYGYHFGFIMECTRLSEEYIRELIKRCPIKAQRPANYLNDSTVFGLNTVRDKSRNEVLCKILPRKIEIARRLKCTHMSNKGIAECTGLSEQDVGELKRLNSDEIVDLPKTDQEVELYSQIAFDYAREQGRDEERAKALEEKKEMARSMARQMLAENEPIDKIVRYTELAIEAVKVL